MGITVQRHYSNLFDIIRPKKENPAHIHKYLIQILYISQEFHKISHQQKKTKAKRK